MQCTLIVVLQGALARRLHLSLGARRARQSTSLRGTPPLNPNREGISESEAYRDFTF
jgi:hypothetical protein